MIRLFTVFCKLNQISLSDRQWQEQDNLSLSSGLERCPLCQTKGSLYDFARYNRYLVELENCHPVTQVISVKRYRCSSCGRTHAVLSSTLVPYRSYSLRFILKILQDYFLRQKTVGQICAAAGIAVSTLYCLKALFLTQKAVWLGVLDDLSTPAATFIGGISGKSLRQFHQRFRCSFLERMNVTVRAATLFHGHG